MLSTHLGGSGRGSSFHPQLGPNHSWHIHMPSWRQGAGQSPRDLFLTHKHKHRRHLPTDKTCHRDCRSWHFNQWHDTIPHIQMRQRSEVIRNQPSLGGCREGVQGTSGDPEPWAVRWYGRGWDVSGIAQEAGMPTSLEDACYSVLVLLLELAPWLKHIMNHSQMCLMISDQDKDLLMYIIDLEEGEGGWGQSDGENGQGRWGCGVVSVIYHIICTCAVWVFGEEKWKVLVAPWQASWGL